FLSFYCARRPCSLHSFPTRRSSDLLGKRQQRLADLRDEIIGLVLSCQFHELGGAGVGERHVILFLRRRLAGGINVLDPLPPFDQDRKSTRLNSSHRTISYAVFCLKK